MMVVGPTGAGKSVLLGLIAIQFRRYPASQVYIFDKGFSARAAVLAMGGVHHAFHVHRRDRELALAEEVHGDGPVDERVVFGQRIVFRGEGSHRQRLVVLVSGASSEPSGWPDTRGG